MIWLRRTPRPPSNSSCRFWTPSRRAPFVSGLWTELDGTRILAFIGHWSFARFRISMSRFHCWPSSACEVNAMMRELLKKRFDLARAGRDASALSELAREDQRWVSLIRGTTLPSFLQVPRPLFSLKAADQPIRVLAFGDYGNGSTIEREVAEAMKRFHQTSPFDFGITLGDNFYSKGMESPTDPRWKTWWDELYDPMGIRIYASLGNHDWGFADSPAAEVLYTQKSPSWRMPATYYSFTAGSVQFFALDTNEIPELQMQWLNKELDASKALWKVVYGHHPIFSAG